MLSSSTKSTGIDRSSTTGRLTATSAASRPARESFFVFTYKKLMSLFTAIWGKTRKSLWVLSTGFILLVLPFTFAYISEFQKQAAKILGTNDGHFL